MRELLNYYTWAGTVTRILKGSIVFLGSFNYIHCSQSAQAQFHSFSAKRSRGPDPRVHCVDIKSDYDVVKLPEHLRISKKRKVLISASKNAPSPKRTLLITSKVAKHNFIHFPGSGLVGKRWFTGGQSRGFLVPL